MSLDMRVVTGEDLQPGDWFNAINQESGQIHSEVFEVTKIEGGYFFF